MHVELMVRGVERDGLLRQAVRNRALAAVEALVAVLANVVVRALTTPVPVPDEGRRSAPVAGDALVFPEMRGALFLCVFGVKLDVWRRDGSVLTCSHPRVVSVRPETQPRLAPEVIPGWHPKALRFVVPSFASSSSPPVASAQPASRPPWQRSPRASPPSRRRP